MSQNNEMDKIKHPIGLFEYKEEIDFETVKSSIQDIESLPIRLKKAVSHLSDEQLNTSYRTGGWTIRQLVHHFFDSHVNGYIRIKMTLTEDTSTIKPFDQDTWTETPENSLFTIPDALEFLNLLHKKWVLLLNALDESQLDLKFNHPEWGAYDLRNTIALYAWHGNHHLEQIKGLIEREGW